MIREPPVENDFCAGCGLCCDGTLFGHARVDEGEECDLVAQGFDLFDLKGERQFRQPCPMLKEGRCSVYASRPQTCQDFQCELLKRHNLGELDPGEGLRRVAEAKTLRGAAVACDPGAAFDGRRQALWQSLSDQVKTADGREGQDLASRLLAVAAFETYLRQWFRKARA